MENFICNQCGEKLTIWSTENIKICGWITKLEVIKNAICLRFLSHLQKTWFLISQGSVATYLRWGGYCRIGFVANFIRFLAVQQFCKSVKIWQSYRQFKGGNFLRQCSWPWFTWIMAVKLTYVYVHACRSRAAADFTESESEIGVILRRRRRRNRSTETLTYAADGDWAGSQCTLSRCARHTAGSVLVHCSTHAHPGVCSFSKQDLVKMTTPHFSFLMFLFCCYNIFIFIGAFSFCCVRFSFFQYQPDEHLQSDLFFVKFDVKLMPSVLLHCWLHIRKSIRPVINWVMRCWLGCLSGVRCKWFANGPADATATLSSLASLKSRLV